MSKEAQRVGVFPSKILLAIDDSKEADLATRKAVELADSTSSELHLVYVGQLPNFLMKDLDTIGFDRPLYEEIERDALEALWHLYLQIKATGGGVDGAHLRMGGVAEEIVNLARDLEADLIVIGNRGHGGLRSTIEGSISEYVVRRAHCPVMIVRGAKGKKYRGFLRRLFSFDSASFG